MSASKREQEAHGQQNSTEKPFLRVHKIAQSINIPVKLDTLKQTKYINISILKKLCYVPSLIEIGQDILKKIFNFRIFY